MQSSVSAICVDPKRIHEFWPYARDLIEAAVKRTKLSAWCDIEDAVLCGDQLLWMAWNGKEIEAAATTHLVETEEKPVCVLTACGGKDMGRWLPLFSDIETYAKNEGCSCVRIFGRKGWARVLANYQVKHVILERPL
jgi:hypothetical protein